MKKTFAWLCCVMLLLTCVSPCSTALAGGSDITSSTPLNNSSSAKIHNIELAATSIDMTELNYGETFSFNDIVGARTKENGYKTALNGRGVKVVGGGVAQVATTLYLALLQMDDIEYESLRTYDSKFTDDYVDSGYYAVLTDDKSDIDFSFTSYYSGTLTIYMWINDDSVNCTVSMDGNGGQARDLVGSASTPVYGSSAKKGNIELAAGSIFGTTLYPYDTFSFNELVGPRTRQYGYKEAVNGRGAMVTGGGVAQVASTVYLAVKDLANVSITEKKTYNNFTEQYVDDTDAAIVTDYNAGTDFSFLYTGDSSLLIYTYISDDELICEVYEH